ncbi:tRNA cytosine(34) acetyltransferase [hydrothermal vent metagenome]|uniref:tRNA cytosine(34) acetyltransferase n=1 Tax=hydrothermal vent metagenome TaxID=652676 RepID=A0A3B0Z8P8_9ZZZZ
MIAEQKLTDYLQLAQALRDQARQQHHRRILVLSGEAAWCRSVALAICSSFAEPNHCWVGEPRSDINSVTNSQARGLLGSECALLVYDAHAGFDPDAFGAVVGTICGGGLLLLLTPPLSEWPAFDGPDDVRLRVANSGRFIQYFTHQLRATEGVIFCPQGEPLPFLSPLSAVVTQAEAVQPPYLTQDQQRAVEAIHHVRQGHRRRPLVITSDRGRGKSSALGLAAAQLLQQGAKRVLVTAPNRQAVCPIFDQAARLLAVEVSGNSLCWQGAVLQFIAPDQLLASNQKTDLLLVDEAAAIPVAILQALLARYSRIVFASTIHGYEGSGRGFAIRFQQHLDEVTPGWQALHLKQPIRWSNNDPLEVLLFNALCLDAEVDRLDDMATLRPEQCCVRLVTQQELLENHSLLKALFGLLVSAHYRTSPSDLQHLLDDSALSLYLMQTPQKMGAQVVGVLLLADEGGFDAEMATQIQQGRRRPRGHLLAQTLTAHLGLLNGAQLNSGRVMRIAIHPQLQRQGFGHHLLSAVKVACGERQLDLFGASFGATTELLHFWQHEGLEPVLLGIGRESSSGAHAALVLQPLSGAGELLFQQARQRGRQFLLTQFAEPLASLDIEVALLLLRQQLDLPLPPLENLDLLDLHHFAYHQRGYELTLHALRPLACWGLVNHQSELNHSQCNLLLQRVLQQRPVDECLQRGDFTGRKPLILALREITQCLLDLLPEDRYEKPPIQ